MLKVARQAYSTNGIVYVIEGGLKILLRFWWLRLQIFPEQYFRFTCHGRAFTFNGEQLPYLIKRYNRTWRRERTVEVPIVLSLITREGQGRVLEVGDVLSHYVKFPHDLVDKYERNVAAIKSDIVNFSPVSKYDLVVSISTFEHIGYDEHIYYDKNEPRNPSKILEVIENLKRNCLNPGGKIIFTLPVGYNRELDRYITEGVLQVTELFYMKRVSRDNQWVQVSEKEASDLTYGKRFPFANAVVIGVIKT